jgi:hypothetical protein
MKFKLLPLALALLVGTSAYAGVTMGNSQAAFSASGSITQNTNFDSYGSGFTSLPNPYTVGDLTFSSGDNLVVGTGSGYSPVKNVLAYNGWSPMPGTIGGSHNLFGFDLGYLGSQSDITISLSTNVGSYSFIVQSPASAGESFTGFSLASAMGAGSAPVITDVQLGTVSAVPEPETLAMMLAGMGLMGAVVRRRKAQQA